MKNFTLLLFIPVLLSCRSSDNRGIVKNEDKSKQDYTSFRERDRILAVAHYNSANYFIYKGRPMGFHYDLLMEFSEYIGMPIEVVVEDDLENNFNALNEDEIDLIATNLTITKERKNKVDFTIPHSSVKQVLVQQIPGELIGVNENLLNESLIRKAVDLGGKTVYVQKNTSFVQRLKHLSDEIGDTIYIIEVDEETEELISLVASGEIAYTVCDEHIARANKRYFSNIDISTPVSLDQNIAWAVRKGNDELRLEIDSWLAEFKNNRKFNIIYNKYFKSDYTQDLRDSDFYTFNTGRVSNYDEYIKTFAEEINWDWKLLASMIYQESRFNPNVRSWVGAYGLMQLMPYTAERFGIDSTATPKENIRAGVDFIKWLDRRFTDVQDKDERIKFVLASYNVGLGHVLDARRLAEKNGKNPNVWNNSVDYYMLNKSKPEYYHQPEVKYGYCRGIEPYNYVKQIMDRYNHYQNINLN